MAFSFPPPSQLEPLLPDMEDDDEAEGKEGRGMWEWRQVTWSGGFETDHFKSR